MLGISREQKEVPENDNGDKNRFLTVDDIEPSYPRKYKNGAD